MAWVTNVSTSPDLYIEFRRWGRPGTKKHFFFGNFFQHVKKLINFLNLLNINVTKSKPNHLGFYCKLYFLIGQSERSEIEIEN